MLPRRYLVDIWSERPSLKEGRETLLSTKLKEVREAAQRRVPHVVAGRVQQTTKPRDSVGASFYEGNCLEKKIRHIDILFVTQLVGGSGGRIITVVLQCLQKKLFSFW